MQRFILGCVFLVAAMPATAEWTLDNTNSTVSFISIKKDNIAEVNTFKEMAGTIDDAGNAKVQLQLNSVDSKIPLRDERLRAVLFETGKFPQAEIDAQIEPGAINSLQPGQSLALTLAGALHLHGQQKTLSIDALVSRLNDDRLLVVSRLPLIINAGDYALVAGIDQLREIAGLPRISTAVPVTFVLTFDR